EPDSEIKKFIHDKNVIIKEQNEITSMIAKYEKENPAIGLIPNIQHNIVLKDPNKIIRLNEFPIALKMREAVQNEIKRLLKTGIIRKSNSIFSSPAFPIPKKNDTIRLVVDYRELNKNTLVYPFPFPDLKYQLLQLHGSKI